MPPLQPITKIEPALPLPITPTGIEASKVVNAEKTAPDMFESTGVKPRKPCNCTKSQCLKLYCECFANGEFCNNCNCNNCFNNLAHEESRQRAIKQCLERNPNAFRPKVVILLNDTLLQLNAIYFHSRLASWTMMVNESITRDAIAKGQGVSKIIVSVTKPR